MKRTQIQLDEETYSTVKRLAYESGRSFSSVIRETLDRSLGIGAGRRRTGKRQFTFVGAGSSRQRGKMAPVSERHDEALAEALLEKKRRR